MYSTCLSRRVSFWLSTASRERAERSNALRNSAIFLILDAITSTNSRLFQSCWIWLWTEDTAQGIAIYKFKKQNYNSLLLHTYLLAKCWEKRAKCPWKASISSKVTGEYRFLHTIFLWVPSAGILLAKNRFYTGTSIATFHNGHTSLRSTTKSLQSLNWSSRLFLWTSLFGSLMRPVHKAF